ncbi:MAG: hypothetical protein J7555_11010 [Chloroflexi bacterium]|nr:hypothetical protein [Chloroflexota bacterium]
MVIAYLTLLPLLIVGGLAAFLKLRNPLARAAGLILFGAGLLAIFVLPAFWRVPPSGY